jgi:hypothetical protein
LGLQLADRSLQLGVWNWFMVKPLDLIVNDALQQRKI